MSRVLLVFLDGVGMGDDDATYNPFVTADLPVLRSVLDGRAVVRGSAPYHASRASLVAIDATLGVPGTPQSGTGQAALLTGVNAAQRYGRHFGPWVPAQLRPLVRDENVLVRAKAAGRRVTFANAYPEEVLADAGTAAALPSDAAGAIVGTAQSRPSLGEQALRPAAPLSRVPAHRRARTGAAFLRAGPPLAALGAGVLNRHTPELERGDAIASEITNDGWREHLGRSSVPVIDAASAGRNLAGIAAAHDLTLFAHYATDYAGHQRDMPAARFALERCDAFFGGIVEHLPADMLLVVASDHGNIEDVRVGHTRNPSIGLVFGAGHETFARRMHALTDIAPAILESLKERSE
jgi:2,3-bisphosphoglycerate-independent phosphoglycerate mutase